MLNWELFEDGELLRHLRRMRAVVFDISYANDGGCETSWNAVPVPLDDLHFE